MRSDVAPRIDDGTLDAITRRCATELVATAARGLERTLADRPDHDPFRGLIERVHRWLDAVEAGEEEALCKAAIASREAFSRLLVNANLGGEDRALCAALGRLAACVEIADRACVMARMLRAS